MFRFKVILFFCVAVVMVLSACQPPATAMPVPTATVTVPPPGIGSTMTGKDGATLLYVPAGEFIMGTDRIDSAYFDSGNPQHSVTLQAFWIDQTEVTNKMYAKCVEAGKCKLPVNTKHFDNAKYTNHPVAYVTWYQAADYCAWTGRRLPTEAEWEKAARGTDGRLFPWGNNDRTCDLANHNKSCVGDTAPVGSYESGKSPYGAYDMSGNVWEWVHTVYKPYPYNASDGREDEKSLDLRIMRGGSWDNYGIFNMYLVRTYIRGWADPSYSMHFVGFRCAVSP